MNTMAKPMVNPTNNLILKLIKRNFNRLITIFTFLKNDFSTSAIWVFLTRHCKALAVPSGRRGQSLVPTSAYAEKLQVFVEQVGPIITIPVLAGPARELLMIYLIPCA